MEEFDFSENENEMSTSINTLRKKKSELDNEKPYNVIRNKLYNEINAPPLQQTSVYVPDNVITHQQNIKKYKKHKNKTYNYQNLFIFVIIFFLVNMYELNMYLIQQKLSYYTIIFIKLLLFMFLYYVTRKFLI